MPTELIPWFGFPTLSEATALFVVRGLEARDCLHLPNRVRQDCSVVPKNGGEGGYAPQLISAPYHVFRNMEDDRMNIGDFYVSHFSRLVPILGLNRRRGRQLQ